MATAVINGVVVSGSVEEIYQLIAKVTTKVNIATVNIATSTDNVGITPDYLKNATDPSAGGTK